MGFFDKILNRKPKFNQKRSITRQAIWTEREYAEKCIENYTYLLCLNYMTKAFVEAPLIVQKYDHKLKTWVRVEDSIATKLEAKFRYLSDNYSNYSVWYSIIHNMYDKGIGLSKLTYTDSDKTDFSSFLPVSHERIDFKCSDTTGMLKAIKIGDNGWEPVEDFIVIRHGISDKNLEKGYSMGMSGSYALQLDNNTLHMVRTLAQNLGVEIPLISPKAGVELEVDDDGGGIETIWKSKTTGDNRGEPIVSNFPIDVTMVGAKLVDLNTKDLFWSSASKVAAMFPLDLGLLGFQTGSSVYNDKISAKENFYDTMMMPLQSLIAQDLSRQLLPRYFGSEWKEYRLTFDYSAIPAVQRIVARNRESIGTLYREKVIDRQIAKSLANIPFTEEDNGVYFTLNQVKIIDNSGDPDMQGKKLADANNQLP